MTQTETARKWTVEIAAGVDVSDYVDADRLSRSDTLSVARAEGVAVVAQFIREGMASDGSVTVYKQLKGDPSPVRDRSWYVFRDHNGAIKSQVGS